MVLFYIYVLNGLYLEVKKLRDALQEQKMAISNK
jgi:hypothetical protein